MTRIRWTRAAAEDLEHIKDYLTEHYPQFTQSTVLELYETIRSLKTSPLRGRLGRVKGTREVGLPRLPYIVVYRVREQAAEPCTFPTARRTAHNPQGARFTVEQVASHWSPITR